MFEELLRADYTDPWSLKKGVGNTYYNFGSFFGMMLSNTGHLLLVLKGTVLFHQVKHQLLFIFLFGHLAFPYPLDVLY